ncbi:PH domain-containing protein [Saccharopolyspora sp. 7B]|nr:PH domain-containing protein [Saccharopolyspora sp. 7B]
MLRYPGARGNLDLAGECVRGTFRRHDGERVADPRAAAQEYGRLLARGEEIHSAYRLIRDSLLFTDRRLILVDKQGMTGKKVEYHSIPYRSISHFAVETAGTFDLDAELKLWLSGAYEPIVKQFGKGVDVYEVQAVLSAYVAR